MQRKKSIYIVSRACFDQSRPHQGENVKHEIEIIRVLRQTVSFFLRNRKRR
jgi:hypothetical protein